MDERNEVLNNFQSRQVLKIVEVEVNERACSLHEDGGNESEKVGTGEAE